MSFQDKYPERPAQIPHSINLPEIMPRLTHGQPCPPIPKLPVTWYRQDSCALSDSPIGPPSGTATPPAESRPGSGGAPLALRDVLEPGGHEHEGALPVGKRPDHAGASADLAVESLDGVVRAYAPPVLPREARVGQGLLVALAGDLAASPSLDFSSSEATPRALASQASRDSMAWTALSMAATLGLFDLGTLASTLR